MKPPDRLPWYVPVQVADIPEGGRHLLSLRTEPRAPRLRIDRWNAVDATRMPQFDIARNGADGLRVTARYTRLSARIAS